MNVQKSRLSQKQQDFLIPVFLYVLLLTYKLIVVIHLRSEPQVADEFTYLKMARLLYQNGSYNSVQYPLLYPLFLLPAVLTGDHFYLTAKILGAISSAFVPVCTYAIARLIPGPGKECDSGSVFREIPLHYVTTRPS